MTVVRKIDGAWQALRGRVTLTEMATTATMHFRGTRADETVTVEPYEVETQPMDAGKVEQLLAEGVWGDEEKARYGLQVAQPFTPPEGKRRVGEPRYVESKGVVSEVYDVEDIPPPPPPPTKEEKLNRLMADYGLTREDMGELLAPEAKAAR